jgi:hypothetical protein
MSFAILMTATQASSQTNDLTNIRNAGAFKCSQIIPLLESAGRELEKTAFLQWTAGFSTAASKSNSLMEMVKMTALVCKENLEQTYESALRSTIGRLRPFWISDDPRVLSITTPSGGKVEMFAAATQPLQTILSANGITISVDGVYGNQTGNALLQYGASKGVTPRQELNGEYLYLLTRP